LNPLEAAPLMQAGGDLTLKNGVAFVNYSGPATARWAAPNGV
jgi:hypothetical protein